jgi:hypothetical protein
MNELDVLLEDPLVVMYRLDGARWPLRLVKAALARESIRKMMIASRWSLYLAERKRVDEVLWEYGYIGRWNTNTGLPGLAWLTALERR